MALGSGIRGFRGLAGVIGCAHFKAGMRLSLHQLNVWVNSALVKPLFRAMPIEFVSAGRALEQFSSHSAQTDCAIGSELCRESSD
jgi:hypothetical protein